MGYSVDCGVIRVKENGELLHISFRERTGRASSQTRNRKPLSARKTGSHLLDTSRVL